MGLRVELKCEENSHSFVLIQAVGSNLFKPINDLYEVFKSIDKKRDRLNCMKHFLSQLPYPNKDKKIVHGPDPLIVGHAARVVDKDEHILGLSLHPESRKPN